MTDFKIETNVTPEIEHKLDEIEKKLKELANEN